jgi:phosphate transport system substrate-binding protein
MKFHWIHLVLGLCTGIAGLLTSGCSRSNRRAEATAAVSDSLRGSLQISGAFALYPMAVRWAEEFRHLHPGVRIDISGGGAGKGMTDVLAGVVDIGMVSREIYPEELNKGAYPLSTVIDVVLPTVNARNPEIEQIRRVGLTREKAARLWTRKIQNWGEVLGTHSKIPVHVFTRSDACGAAETFAAWFGLKQESLRAIAIYGDPGVASAVQKDRVSIGFNNIAYVYDGENRRPFEGLEVIPLDINEDGVIDSTEQCYATVDSLVCAVAAGRFPSPPARSLYMVTRGKPSNPILLAFLQFVLSEGQRFAGESGYIALPETLRQKQWQKLQ